MKKINWALLLFLTTMLFACNADDVTAETETETTTKNTQKRLNGQIPFTVENVQNAYLLFWLIIMNISLK